MSYTEDLIQRLIDNKISELHTIMPCKVESYNSSTNPPTAKVNPLFMTKFANNDTATQIPPLINVPVTVHKWIDTNGVVHIEPLYLQPGDVCVVAFAERALDMVIGGTIADPVYNRKHSLEDGIIIGVL